MNKKVLPTLCLMATALTGISNMSNAAQSAGQYPHDEVTTVNKGYVVINTTEQPIAPHPLTGATLICPKELRNFKMVIQKGEPMCKVQKSSGEKLTTVKPLSVQGYLDMIYPKGTHTVTRIDASTSFMYHANKALIIYYDVLGAE